MDIIDAYLEVGFTESEIMELYEQEEQVLLEKVIKKGDVAYGSIGGAAGAVAGGLIGSALSRRKQKGKVFKDKNAVKKATLTGMGVGSVVGGAAGVGLNRYFKKEEIAKLKKYNTMSSEDQRKIRVYYTKKLGRTTPISDRQMRKIIAKVEDFVYKK